MTGGWVKGYEAPDRSTSIEHLDGVAWFDAPLPSRFHRCTPQTKGWTYWFTQTFRCACGAISFDGKHWSERNSRRRSERLRKLASATDPWGE